MKKLIAPKNVILLLEEIKNEFEKILGADLVGIYLHGSLSMGSFNPKTSDIDFLIIVNKSLSILVKKHIIATLLKLSKKAPAKGLEMSVVQLKYLKRFKYPTPFELHYSKDWQNDKINYNKRDKDVDLASHFVKTLKRGYKLYGAPIKDIFPEIPTHVYMKSIMSDLEDIVKTIAKNPVYSVLNLARTLKDIKEGSISSKQEGGQWALKHIATEFKPLVRQALNIYQSKKNKASWNTVQLKKFANYALGEIKAGI